MNKVKSSAFKALEVEVGPLMMQNDFFVMLWHFVLLLHSNIVSLIIKK